MACRTHQALHPSHPTIIVTILTLDRIRHKNLIYGCIYRGMEEDEPPTKKNYSGPKYCPTLFSTKSMIDCQGLVCTHGNGSNPHILHNDPIICE